MPDERWGEAVKAVVVLKPGASASDANILAQCAAAFEQRHHPTRLVRRSLLSSALRNSQRFQAT